MKPDDVRIALKNLAECERIEFLPLATELRKPSPAGFRAEFFCSACRVAASLVAKATAGIFGVPLLRLDFGVLYNKYYGETGRNLRKAFETAEVMSPCVLWMDEIEKGGRCRMTMMVFRGGCWELS